MREAINDAEILINMLAEAGLDIALPPGILMYLVKTLQGLEMLNVSMVAVKAMVQWFNGSMV
jgi:hypothetical protein